jgi:UDP-GlcNAc:undecaprenyl-phosphate GlcNAc-1-phosphate transferase
VLVPLNIKFSKRIGLIDFPHERGIHKGNIPVAGGLSFGISIIFFQIIFYLCSRLLNLNNEIALNMLKLASGGGLILVLGFLDDKKKFTARYKLIFQILIVSLMYFLGFKITLLTNPFGMDIELGLSSFPMTILWFILVINAFNLIDGVDGLASGIAAIVSLVLFSVGIVYSNQFIALSSVTLIGATLAFLRYNFFPAKIFMGDTGSLFLGFNIAAISVAGTEQYKGITTMTLLIPIIVLVVPLSDTVLTVFRRIKRRKHIFKADKEHLHHKMLDLGLSQKAIALLSYFVTFLFGLIAFGFSLASKNILFILLIIISLILLVTIYFLLKVGKKK